MGDRRPGGQQDENENEDEDEDEDGGEELGKKQGRDRKGYEQQQCEQQEWE